MEKIGEKLKILRIKHNLSQKELAQKLNVSNKLISKWENDLSVPSLEYMQELCTIFKVDLNYFFKIRKNKKTQFTPKQKKDIKIAGITLACTIFAVSIILLSIYVFAPAIWKNGYIKTINHCIENNLDLGYYSFSIQNKCDDEINITSEQGIIENDSFSYISYDNGKTSFLVKDNVKYSPYTTGMEYINKTIVTTKELYQEFSQSNIEEIFLNKKFISYVRQTTYGYYIEYKDELYTQNLSESEKKNTIMRGKIHATVTIKNGMLIKINRVISYKDKLTSETFDIYDTLKFSFFKPTIEHRNNLQNHCWTTNHTQLSSTTKFVETLPSDYLVETLNFDGKNNGFVHNGKMLFLEDGSLFVYNLETAVSEKTINIKPKMGSLYSQYDFKYNIISCYGNTVIFYTSRGKDTFNTHYINLATSEYEQLNFGDLYKIKFNGKYMSYFNRYSSRKTDVYNLETMQYISFDNEALYLTDDGQIFYEDWTANDALTLTDASNNTYRFEGKYVIHQQAGVVFTYGNGIVYKYINYVLVDQFECQLENEQTQSYVFNDTIFWNWTVFPVGISKDNNPNFLIPTYEAYCNHYLTRGLTFKVLGLYGDKVLVRTEGYYGNYAMVYDLNRPLTPPIIIKNISIENNAAYVFTSDGALKISKAII